MATTSNSEVAAELTTESAKFRNLGVAPSCFLIKGSDFIISTWTTVFKGEASADLWRGYKCLSDINFKVNLSCNETVIDGNTIVFYSNSEASPNVLRRFDLETQKWKWIPTAGSFPPCRVGFRMAVCQGLLVVFGGCTEDSNPKEYSNDIHVYRLNQWRRLPAIDDGPTPRLEAIMLTIENKIYVIGGCSKSIHQDIWTLDMTNVIKNPRSGIPTWELLTTSGPQRLCGTAAAHNNKLYIFGGEVFLGPDHGVVYFNDTTIFDSQLRKWYWLDPPESKNTSTRRLAYHYSKDGALQEIEVDPLDPKKAFTDFKPTQSRTLDDSEWKVTPKDLSMPLPRSRAKTAVQDGWLYMMGGMLWSCNPEHIIHLDDCWKLQLGRSKAHWELVRPGTYWKALVSN
eukprot:Blabericola_migrator_1__6537@NODE_3298_length_1879_cov_203_542494_g2061_i0_p1_GENE_NODE_3298_length_1879_cov_203_542494_g2061_i0NODE_3298_length_1879_cov_203_542494_g2061_i0_p1_ORF_typecomplete_len398_score76_16Kelch_2/PF07646_15/2_9Kelch_2/PF07646_15/1_4e07Kelch_2/PF07646_15/0_032Kelch_2/PF07646_15/1_7e06Kelch_2/PF07646_15/91Kelch_6/PF13964_6/1_1e04Kelch_6/PF13964_6/0_47Kelch_6/PF13964_6/5_6e07Kelch_6/PF13964_6/0_017Kelch_6/PF13964_6/6_2e06Kelch_6/PF13964_6/4_7Kelch_4/PF13418_6/25Kelch_4/PF1341